jgi:hypothetical protein
MTIIGDAVAGANFTRSTALYRQPAFLEEISR